jgi:hypothetical protein
MTPDRKNKRTSISTGVVTLSLLALFFYVAALHAWISYVLPNPFILPDGVDYLMPAINVIHGKPFDVGLARAYGYPVFLAVCLKLFGTLTAVARIQHLIGLGIGVLTAWMARIFTRASWVVTGLVFLFVASSPRVVFYAHSILSENLFVFVQMLLLGALLLAIYRRSKGWALAAGLLLAVALNIRPVGRAWLFALLLMALLNCRARSFRRLMTFAAIGFLIGAIPVCAVNRAVRGFWGFEQIGGWYVAGNLLRYIDVNQVSDPVLRDFLRPYFVPEMASRRADLNWVWYDRQGPIRQLRNHPILGLAPESSYRRLIFLALRHSPGHILVATARQAFLFVLKGSFSPEDVNKEQGAVESLRLFAAATEGFPNERHRLFGVAPENIPSYLNRIGSLSAYPFEAGPGVFRLSWWTRQWTGYASWLAWVAAMLLIWKKRKRLGIRLIVFAMAFQVLLVAAGGVYFTRYSAPLEPLFALLLAFATKALNPRRLFLSENVVLRAQR